jgi:exonuclease III
MTNNSKLTPASGALLVKIIQAAEYEGSDGMNEALMDFSKEERGNLSDLKKKGYVETFKDPDAHGYTWCILQEPSRPLYEALNK